MPFKIAADREQKGAGDKVGDAGGEGDGGCEQAKLRRWCGWSLVRGSAAALRAAA